MIRNIKKIPKIWIINQFANTPNMPGGTRHFEIANYFSKLEWKTEVFSSDFNLSSRKYLILKKFELWKTQEFNRIKWHWLRTFPYKKNDFWNTLIILVFV